MRNTISIIIIGAILLGGCLAATAQNKQPAISYDLPALLSAHELSITNREASQLPANEKPGIRLSASAGDGVVWLNTAKFANGIIELDIRGKNVEQQSFLGVAFHGLPDAKTLDAVYFRPFNFLAADSVKRSHSVQYVAHPLYPWPVLREKFTDKYENSIHPVPDPDVWVHIRIEVNYPEVKAFVNGNTKPSLQIKQLSDRKTGLLGLWVGNNSGGDFANLKVTFFDNK